MHSQNTYFEFTAVIKFFTCERPAILIRIQNVLFLSMILNFDTTTIVLTLVICY